MEEIKGNKNMKTRKRNDRAEEVERERQREVGRTEQH